MKRVSWPWAWGLRGIGVILTCGLLKKLLSAEIAEKFRWGRGEIPGQQRLPSGMGLLYTYRFWIWCRLAKHASLTHTFRPQEFGHSRKLAQVLRRANCGRLRMTRHIATAGLEFGLERFMKAFVVLKPFAIFVLIFAAVAPFPLRA